MAPKRRSAKVREKKRNRNGRISAGSITRAGALDIPSGYGSQKSGARSQKKAAMKWIRYSKYTGEDLGIEPEQLLQALSDFLLASGFEAQFNPRSEEHTSELQSLRHL